MRVVTPVFLVVGAAGHSSLTYPPPRTGQTQAYAGSCPGMMVPTPIGPAPHPTWGTAPQNGTCDWYSQGCQPGCDKCNEKCGHASAAFGLCCGFASETHPTLPDEFRTYKDIAAVIDVGMRYNPWRSPGKAPVMDPCGVLAGDQPGEYIVGGPDPGTRGSSLPETQGPEWAAGSEQEVSWSLYANHGGGYSYRLCPKTEALTEECMQRTPLQFAGDVSWIQYGDDVANRTEIFGFRLSEGTHPAGSSWKKNPIPACSGDVGGAANPFYIPGLDNCKKAQFDPPMAGKVTTHPKWAPLPGLYGFGVGAVGPEIDEEQFRFWTERFSFNIIDKVTIPSDLTPGEYVLGFRWDCEQTPQVWQNCADVTITAPAGSVQV